MLIQIIVNLHCVLLMDIIILDFRERLTQIESKLSEVRAGKAMEYIQPLEELEVIHRLLNARPMRDHVIFSTFQLYLMRFF